MIFRSFTTILTITLLRTPLPGAVERPNLIFILAEVRGYGDLGSYGQEIIKTPHLDRTAAEVM